MRSRLSQELGQDEVVGKSGAGSGGGRGEVGGWVRMRPWGSLEPGQDDVAVKSGAG